MPIQNTRKRRQRIQARLQYGFDELAVGTIWTIAGNDPDPSLLICRSIRDLDNSDEICTHYIETHIIGDSSHLS